MSRIMGGWVTWLAAIAMILNGIADVLTGFAPIFEGSPVDGALIQQGIAKITAGLAMIGIGRKIEKKKS